MTYELAKELKDAGFPLKCSEFGSDEFVFGTVIHPENGPLMYPLLGELVEACSGELMLYRDIGAIVKYTAGIARSGLILEGKTPQEAVARLWLALNKK